MANIVINVDTGNKTVSATVDGNNVDDLRDVLIFTEKSGMGFTIELASVSEGDNLKKIVRLVADKDGEMVEDTNVQKDILEYFNS